jgi:hypothetical protein
MKLNADLLIILCKCIVTALGLANPYQSPTATYGDNQSQNVDSRYDGGVGDCEWC